MPVGRLKSIWYRLNCWGCRIGCVLFFHFRIYGAQNIPAKGGFLLVSNHQSYLDPIFCAAFLKRRMCFLARDSLFANWFFGWLLRSVNAIPVRRGQADLSAMKALIARLKDGEAVCIFPEGTRTRDGRIAQLRPGFGLLCRRSEVPVVPVIVDGAFECWPRHKKLFSPGKEIVVSYGRAVPAKDAKEMNDRKLAGLLTEALRRMQKDCRVRRGREPYDYQAGKEFGANAGD